VCVGAAVPPDAIAAGSNCPGSAAAAAALRPRYHFAGGCSAYYERAPYSNAVAGLPPRAATRFFGIAPVGNAAKEKWIYAFSIEPASQMDQAALLAAPPGLTPSPYAGRRPLPGMAPPVAPPPAAPSFFFAAQPAGRGRGGGGRDNKRRRTDGDAAPGGGGGPSLLGEAPAPGVPRPNRPPRKPTGPCWFCLGGAEVEKHLVTSIGKNVYLALAKGGLTPDHVLILPITHVPSTLQLDDDTRAEVDDYKAALRAFFESQGKACVMWERNMRSQHLQLQVVPVPQAVAEAAEATFRERGTAMGPNFKWEVRACARTHTHTRRHTCVRRCRCRTLRRICVQLPSWPSI
jgi:hypothetical protein